MGRDPQRKDTDEPSIRQRLHAATGDRDAEAKALADRAGDDVSEADAKEAVQRAHGDSGAPGSPIDTDLASTEDAKAAKTGESP
jgi:hypothetical protein